MPSNFPDWTLTLGALIDREQPIRVICTKCRGFRELDLVALAERVGRDYSLINRRCRCRLTRRCSGWNRFYYQSGVFRPLWSEEQARRWVFSDRPC